MGKFDIREHKKHYYIEMEGHTICPKCYAIKYMDEELARRDQEWREKINNLKDDGCEFMEADARDICQHCGKWRDEHFKQPGFNQALSTLLEDKQ